MRSRREAFDRYLGTNGPAYVKRYAAELFDMVRCVAEAGGVTVIAHPWAARHNHEARDGPALQSLKDAGEISQVEAGSISERGGLEVSTLRMLAGTTPIRTLMYRAANGKIEEFLFNRR